MITIPLIFYLFSLECSFFMNRHIIGNNRSFCKFHYENLKKENKDLTNTCTKTYLSKNIYTYSNNIIDYLIN